MTKRFYSIIKTATFVAVIAVATTASVASAVSATAVPSCSIIATPAAINSNQSAKLKWISTEGAIFASLDNGIGAIAPDGELVVSPNTSTVYTMRSWNSQGEGGYCSVALTVDGQGLIGGTQPTVTLQTLAVHPAATRVVLSNVPYTGAAENILYSLFLLTILLTAGYAARAGRKTLFA